jgi:hypothetical protein
MSATVMRSTRKRRKTIREKPSSSNPDTLTRRSLATWLDPPVLSPVGFWHALPVLAGVAIVLAGLYAWTTPRQVLLEDDGLFLMSTATLGVSHPPGYPVHTILGWLASHVPVSTPAFRVHMLSGVLGALACGVLGWIVLRRTGNRVAACAAALAFGISEHFWSQAILAEVYTLNALFFFVLLALCQEIAASPSRRLLATAALIYGVSLANHWPLIVLATPAFALIVASRWRETLESLHVMLAAALAGAVIPYVWMVWRSNQDPLIGFYGPLQSWHDIYFYISRKGYSSVDASVTAGWTDKFQFAGYVSRQAVQAITPIGAALAVVGMVRQWREGWRLALAGECLAFAASGVVLAFLLGFDYDFLEVAVFRPYPLVAYGLVALWAGLGIARSLEAARERNPAFAFALGTLAFLLPLYLAVAHWRVNDRSGDDFADRHARLLLQLLEPESDLLLYGDSDTGPVGYLHVVEGVRPDVTLYNLQGLVFNNRLMPALASRKVREERLIEFLRETRQPVYHMTDKIVPPLYAEEHLGFLKRLIPSEAAGPPHPVFRPEAASFFRELMAMPQPADRWVRMTRNQLLHQYGNFLGLAELDSNPGLRASIEPLVTLARGDYYSLNGMVEMLTQFGSDKNAWERALAYLNAADVLRDDSLDRERLGRESYLRGFLAFRLGQVQQSEELFRRSVEVDPGPDNASLLALQQLAQLKKTRKQ